MNLRALGSLAGEPVFDEILTRSTCALCPRAIIVWFYHRIHSQCLISSKRLSLLVSLGNQSHIFILIVRESVFHLYLAVMFWMCFNPVMSGVHFDMPQWESGVSGSKRDGMRRAELTVTEARQRGVKVTGLSVSLDIGLNISIGWYYKRVKSYFIKVQHTVFVMLPNGRHLSTTPPIWWFWRRKNQDFSFISLTCHCAKLSYQWLYL